MDREQLISEVIRMELEIMLAISKGHKASNDDEFKIYRELLKTYRNILFGDNDYRQKQGQNN